MNATPARLDEDAFRLVWTRGVSNLGSILASFGLNVWLYRLTDSYAVYALVGAIGLAVPIVVSPIAGYFADRWNKKTILLWCEAASIAAVAIALLAFLIGRLDQFVIAFVIIATAVAAEFRWTGLTAIIPVLTPKDQLPRINGVQQSFRGVGLTMGPLLGAIGLEAIGLSNLLTLDLLSYLVAVGGLLAISGKRLEPSLRRNAPNGLMNEFMAGLRWVLGDRKAMEILIFFMVLNACISVFHVALTPYVLSVGTSGDLGIVLAAEGTGVFGAGLLIARFKGRYSVGGALVIGSVTIGLAAAMLGMTYSLVTGPLLLALIGAAIAAVGTANQTFWQTRVPLELQGRATAVRTVSHYLIAPLSVVASIPLAVALFSPALSSTPALASVWGAGTSGATALLISCSGVGAMAAGVWLSLRFLSSARMERNTCSNCMGERS